MLRGETALPALLERVREAFGLSSVTLLERTTPADGHHGAASRGPADEWTVVASAGAGPCRRPQDADTEVPAGDTLMLALRGRPLLAEDQRVVGAFAAQAAVIIERDRLAEAAATAGPLAQADRTRTALSAAVGHDLRSPLASAKAAVTSLRSKDVDWTPQDRSELLLTADEALDQLARLVDNLLDMSRLRAGALSILSRPVALEDVVPLALDDFGPSGRQVVVDVADDLPYVQGDAGLIQRVVANLVANALRYSPPGTPPVVTGSSLGDRVELRIIDRGPGITPADLERVFTPFQRLGDTDNTTGVGLGLALSRGLTEAMGGSLTAEETPGGGLTMVVSLPAAPADEDAAATDPVCASGPRAGRCGQPRRRSGRTGHDPGPGDRRRAPDRACPVHQPAGPPLRRDHRRDRRRGPRRAPPGTAPSSSSSTWACPTSTGSTSSAVCGGGAPRRSSSCPAAPTAPTRWRPSTPARTTTSPSRSRSTSCSPASARCRGAPASADSIPVVTFGRATVDLAARRVTVTDGASSTDVRLTPTEWHLLEVLLRHPGKLLSQRQLLAEVWGPGYEKAGGNLRFYMAQLRRKLEPDPGRPRHLLTEPGMGYRFQPEERDAVRG